MQVYPSGSDVEYCRNNRGVKSPTQGEGAATWFLWNGCSKYKEYEVVPGKELRFLITGDSCSSCVCYSPNFKIYEYGDLIAEWTMTKQYSPDGYRGYRDNLYYVPQSSKIKVEASKCFYLRVYYRYKQDFLGVCGDGVCAYGEDVASCPKDCTSFRCMEEGESIPTISNRFQCCGSLKLIKPKSGSVTGSSGICTAKCGNGVCDSDVETDYNCPEDCKAMDVSCTDSDGGVEIYVKGRVVDKGHPGTFDNYDKCLSENRILEYSCKNDAWYANYRDCLYGCRDGACVKEKCEVGEYRCEKDSSGRYTDWSQKCYDESKGWVNVAYCSDGCDGLTGQCNSRSSDVLCNDTDGGRNYYVRGECIVCTQSDNSGGCRSVSDYCVDGKRLKEAYCRGNEIESTIYTCSSGCESGACRKACAEGATGFPMTSAVTVDGNDYSVHSLSGDLRIALINNLGKDVTVETIQCDRNSPVRVSERDGSLSAGQSRTMTVSRCVRNPGSEGTCYSIPVVITYGVLEGIKLKSAGRLNGGFIRVRDCPEIHCNLYCKNGFKVDVHGCSICRCRENAEPVEPKPSECNGCLMESGCAVLGTRLKYEGKMSYCSLARKMEVQKSEGKSCQNNYECRSNFCSDDKCVDITKKVERNKDVIQKIMDFLGMLFSI